MAEAAGSGGTGRAPVRVASEINAERTGSGHKPGISRPYYDLTSSASKSVSVVHASLRVAAAQARDAGDHVTAAALDGEAQDIEEALLESVGGPRAARGHGLLVRTGHHSRTPGSGGTGRPRRDLVAAHDQPGRDPQLHVHLAVLNAVQRADGADDTWRAADGQHFYQLRHLYGVTVDRAFEQRLLEWDTP